MSGFREPQMLGQKRRIPNKNGHLRELQVAIFDGGGGNRTRVLWTLDQSFYVCSPLISFATTRLPEQSLPPLDHNKSRIRRSDQ